jgi:hypothetical protein
MSTASGVIEGFTVITAVHDAQAKPVGGAFIATGTESVPWRGFDENGFVLTGHSFFLASADQNDRFNGHSFAVVGYSAELSAADRYSVEKLFEVQVCAGTGAVGHVALHPVMAGHPNFFVRNRPWGAMKFSVHFTLGFPRRGIASAEPQPKGAAEEVRTFAEIAAAVGWTDKTRTPSASPKPRIFMWKTAGLWGSRTSSRGRSFLTDINALDPSPAFLAITGDVISDAFSGQILVAARRGSLKRQTHLGNSREDIPYSSECRQKRLRVGDVSGGLAGAASFTGPSTTAESTLSA